MKTFISTDPAEALADEIGSQAAEGLERIDWRRLQRVAHRSRRQIDRIFRERYFTTPEKHFCDLRTREAQKLLEQGHDVLNAAVRAGFSGPGRLHEALVARRGVTPGEARTGGKGVAIKYGMYQTPIGAVMIAATARGICSLWINAAHGPKRHLEDLRREFPHGTFTEDAAALQEYANQLLDFLSRRARDFHPKLDMHGTAFQREVWAELRRIKAGEVVSYSELARRVGKPKAVRAVASCCARNKVAIAIPCHRVIAKGGGLGGYALGLELKHWLLELESGSKKS